MLSTCSAHKQPQISVIATELNSKQLHNTLTMPLSASLQAICSFTNPLLPKPQDPTQQRAPSPRPL